MSRAPCQVPYIFLQGPAAALGVAFHILFEGFNTLGYEILRQCPAMPAIPRSVNPAGGPTCAALWCRLSSSPCIPCISISFVGCAALLPDLIPAAAAGPSPKV